MSAPIRLILIDDRDDVRHALALRLNTLPDFAVVGEAATAEDGIALVEQHRPQVALVEVKRRDGRGLELVSWIALSGLGTQVLVLTSYASEWEHWAVRRAGGVGYLLKDIDTTELAEQIRLVVSHAG